MSGIRERDSAYAMGAIPVDDQNQLDALDDRAALLQAGDALAEAARAMVLNDGSGIGRHDEWAGPFDSRSLIEAREATRAALTKWRELAG